MLGSETWCCEIFAPAPIRSRWMSASVFVTRMPHGGRRVTSKEEEIMPSGHGRSAQIAGSGPRVVNQLSKLNYSY